MKGGVAGAYLKSSSRLHAGNLQFQCTSADLDSLPDAFSLNIWKIGLVGQRAAPSKCVATGKATAGDSSELGDRLQVRLVCLFTTVDAMNP